MEQGTRACITLTEEMKEQVKELAKADERSFSQFVRKAIKNELERCENMKGTNDGICKVCKKPIVIDVCHNSQNGLCDLCWSEAQEKRSE